MHPLPAQNPTSRSCAFASAGSDDKAAGATWQSAWKTLAVLAVVTLALRVGDAIPGWISSVPRGVHLCASVDEAETRTGLHASSVHAGLAGHALIAGGIRTTSRPIPAVAVAMQGDDGKSQLTFFRSHGSTIPSTLRKPLPSFHEIAVPLGPGLFASLKAERQDDGSVWQDLEWSKDAITTALRFNGRTVELLRLARQLIEDAP